MNSIEVLHWNPTRERIGWLTLSLVLVAVPHVTRIPVWISLTFLVMCVLRLSNAFHGTKLPHRWLRTLLSFAVLIGVFGSYGTLLGRTAGIAALVALSGLKLLETQTLRDAFAICFLAFFIIITNFLHSQSIPTATFMLAAVIVITSTLIVLNTDDQHRTAAMRLRTATIMVAQAIPIMLVLFVLFPRISGPLWGLPKDAYSATTGLSDSMSPGTIGALGLSDAVAFRVKFTGQPPPAAQLYWRGPVFWHTDGRNWSAGSQSKGFARRPPSEGLGKPVDYTLTLEPHQRTWLFALDMPVSIPHNARITEDYQLLAVKPVRERVKLDLRSYPIYRMSHLTDDQRRRALQLAPGAHPKARQLALGWRKTIDDDGRIVQRALAYYRAESFYYTLTPPLLPGDPVDGFLFDSRQGFCELFASSFTVLMRAAGIPARVVTGYQGGEPNLLGDYMIIRQRDAHAWVEVWLNDSGWVRVDPTAAVSPARIVSGMQATLPTPVGPAVLGINPEGALADALRNVRLAWDVVNNSWNLWVLGYGPQRQFQLLRNLGINANDWQHLAVVLSITVGILWLAVAAWLFRRSRNPDLVSRLYLDLCRRLARKGITRRSYEGPKDFAARVSRLRPDLAETMAKITTAYINLRYADVDGDVASLRRQVAHFRP